MPYTIGENCILTPEGAVLYEDIHSLFTGDEIQALLADLNCEEEKAT